MEFIIDLKLIMKFLSKKLIWLIYSHKNSILFGKYTFAKFRLLGQSYKSNARFQKFLAFEWRGDRRQGVQCWQELHSKGAEEFSAIASIVTTKITASRSLKPNTGNIFLQANQVLCERLPIKTVNIPSATSEPTFPFEAFVDDNFIWSKMALTPNWTSYCTPMSLVNVITGCSGVV